MSSTKRDKTETAYMMEAVLGRSEGPSEVVGPEETAILSRDITPELTFPLAEAKDAMLTQSGTSIVPP